MGGPLCGAYGDFARVGHDHEGFHISYATAGSLFSAIFLSYTLMQLPSGYLGDRFGRRKILIISPLLWFFFSLGTALVQSFAMLVAVRFLTGFAHGAYFGNEKPTIVAFTPVEKMGQGQAVSFMGLAFGFFLAVFSSEMIADYTHNWRWVFVVFAFPSIVTTFLVYKYVQDPKPVPKEDATEVRAAYRKAFMGRDLWLMFVLGFTLLYAYWLPATWMPSIYMEMGISTITASSVLFGILGLVGLPGLKHLDHRPLFNLRVLCVRGMAPILCPFGRTDAQGNRGDHIWSGQPHRFFEFLGRPLLHRMGEGYHRLFFGRIVCGGFCSGGGDYSHPGGKNPKSGIAEIRKVRYVFPVPGSACAP